MGRFHLSANSARFDRPTGPSVNKDKPIHPGKHANHGAPSYLSAAKGNPIVQPNISSSPALVLDDALVVHRNLDNFVMGEVKHFASISNICTLISAEGFNNVKPTYLGGLWIMLELDSPKSKEKFMQHVGVLSWFSRLCNAESDFVSRERLVWVDIEGVPLHIWSRATFEKIGSRWGEVMELEESVDDSFARKRICIKTKQEDNILEKFKVIVQRKVFVVRAKELFVWSPVFKNVKEVVYCSDSESDVKGVNNNGPNDENDNFDAESEAEVVSETDFGDKNDGLENGHDHSVNNKEASSDPFGIYAILKKRKVESNHSGVEPSLPHPPGFTPATIPQVPRNQENHNSDTQENVVQKPASPVSAGLNSRVMQENSFYDGNANSVGKDSDKGVNVVRTGGSILATLEEMVKVGEAMGFSMDGCLKDMENIIGSQGDIGGLR
ncbi:RNA-directed DNA polymerase, eukaryota [Tanacetum coccineum]